MAAIDRRSATLDDKVSAFRELLGYFLVDADAFCEEQESRTWVKVGNVNVAHWRASIRTDTSGA